MTIHSMSYRALTQLAQELQEDIEDLRARAYNSRREIGHSIRKIRAREFAKTNVETELSTRKNKKHGTE